MNGYILLTIVFKKTRARCIIVIAASHTNLGLLCLKSCPALRGVMYSRQDLDCHDDVLRAIFTHKNPQEGSEGSGFESLFGFSELK